MPFPDAVNPLAYVANASLTALVVPSAGISRSSLPLSSASQAFQFVGLCEDDGKGYTVLAQPFRKLEVDGLGSQPAIYKNKQTSHLFALQYITFYNTFDLFLPFLSPFGVAISRKVYNVPALVDEEMVDEHGLSRCGRGHGEPFSPGQHIDETGFSYVGASDESIFGKCTSGAFPHVCVTDDEFSVCNIHFVAFLGFYVWQR